MSPTTSYTYPKACPYVFDEARNWRTVFGQRMTLAPMDHCVVANVRRVGGILRTGAKVVILNTNPGWGGDRVEVYGISRGGRAVEAWVSRGHLTGFRRAHCTGLTGQAMRFTRADADRWAMRMVLRSVGFKATP